MARISADLLKLKLSGRDEALARREERAGEAAEHRADGEGGELGRRGVDAERAAGDLVLAHRLPGAADRQAAQPERDEVGEQRQRQDQVEQEHHAMRRRIVETEGRGEAALGVGERQAEEARARDARNAVRSAGQALPVQQHQADDLAKRQRDDGEIVAAQPQHGKAQQDAPERREDAGERQADPERQMEVGGEQRIGVGADRVERDIAEVEQAGEANHDVQPPAEHHVGQHQDAEVEDVAVSVKQHRHQQREDQQRRAGVAACGVDGGRERRRQAERDRAAAERERAHERAREHHATMMAKVSKRVLICSAPVGPWSVRRPIMKKNSPNATKPAMVASFSAQRQISR